MWLGMDGIGVGTPSSITSVLKHDTKLCSNQYECNTGEVMRVSHSEAISPTENHPQADTSKIMDIG